MRKLVEIFTLLLISMLNMFSCFEWTDLNLPPSLIPYYLNSNTDIKKQCENDKLCPYKVQYRVNTTNNTAPFKHYIKTQTMKIGQLFIWPTSSNYQIIFANPAGFFVHVRTTSLGLLNGNKCFGYGEGCDLNKGYSRKHIKCTGKSRRRNIKSISERENIFWRQADFGYIKERKNTLVDICTSDTEDGSTISCSDQQKYCYVKNVFLYRKRPNGFKHTYMAQVLQRFVSYDNFSVTNQHCDIIFDRPTVLIKLDYTVNMYHHFCDFVNLYTSQHMNGSFDMDIDIVWWDTLGYGDRYFGALNQTFWKVFSTRKQIELSSLDGKKICFRQAMLPFLARNGVYYHTPLVDGCSGSGIFHAFSKHSVHRLEVKQEGPILNKIRVTLLSRSTKYRRILNEREIINALSAVSEFEVRKVDYNSNVSLIDQIKSTHNSDIFIGMHGAGLTHCLFLPDWAALFEIYHCQHANCYRELAKLRGIHYRRWEKEDKVKIEFQGKHPTMKTPLRMYANYVFDISEVVRIVLEIADHVRKNRQFIEAQQKLHQNHEEF